MLETFYTTEDNIPGNVYLKILKFAYCYNEIFAFGGRCEIEKYYSFNLIKKNRTILDITTYV